MARKPSRSKKLQQFSIFISYASEDKDLAASFEAELLQLFAYTPVKIFRDVGIARGADYRKAIAAELNAADILLVILTDRMKPGFAYPGFEVGYFTKSLEERPKISGDQDRRIIPVCIGANSPATLDYIQAIKINSDEVVKITDANMPSGQKGDGSPADHLNPAYTLLSSISDIVTNVLGDRSAGKNDPASEARNKAIHDRLSSSAAKLYGNIFAYLQGRISSETYPERKIIIRTDAPPALLSDGADLSKAKVELVGNSFQVFGFPEDKIREFSWSDFATKMPGDTGGTWAAGIRALVTGALQGSNENYHVVATPKGDNAFRLFVSRIVTYVSKQTEIHIYIVQMIFRHYGDALTTRLLSAISIGLQYRFLFLESDSKFRPATFSFPMAMETSKELDFWKATVTELLTQLDLILREAQDQHLMDTDLLDKIWGSDGGPRVQEMMGTWDAARTKLYTAAQQILTTGPSEFENRKGPFRDALGELCAKTQIMNREYTLRALYVISKELETGPGIACDLPVASGAPGAKVQPRPAPAAARAG
jgi:hypothetical protein